MQTSTTSQVVAALPSEIFLQIFLADKESVLIFEQVCSVWKKVIDNSPDLLFYKPSVRYKTLCDLTNKFNQDQESANRLPAIDKIPRAVFELFGSGIKGIDFIYNVPKEIGSVINSSKPIAIFHDTLLAFKVKCSVGPDVYLQIVYNNKKITNISFPYLQASSPIHPDATVEYAQLKKLISGERVNVAADSFYESNNLVDFVSISFEMTNKSK